METTLMCGDCLSRMKTFPNKSIDLILSDLPYSCGKTANKWDKELPLSELWVQYERIIKDDGIICLFGNEPFTSKLILSNLKYFRYKMIWEKESPTGFLNCNYKPLSKFEDIVIFSKGTIGSLSKNPIKYFPQGIIPVNLEKQNNPNSTWREKKGYSAKTNKLNSCEKYIQKYTNYPNDILRFSRDKNNIHPTQKPVSLLQYLIQTYTKDNEIVLDCCSGSMSTAIACLNTNRDCIMIEKDKTFFEDGVNRTLQHIIKNQIKTKVSIIGE